MPEARFWLLKVIGRIFAAPFFYVGFADFWIADQLNSMATVFTDFHFAACFYITPNSTINGKMIKQLMSWVDFKLKGSLLSWEFLQKVFFRDLENNPNSWVSTTIAT